MRNVVPLFFCRTPRGKRPPTYGRSSPTSSTKKNRTKPTSPPPMAAKLAAATPGDRSMLFPFIHRHVHNNGYEV